MLVTRLDAVRRYAQQSSSSRSCVASPDGSQQVDVDRSLVIIVGKYRAQMYMAATIGEEAMARSSTRS